MPKLVDLHDYRTKVVEQKVFGPWQKRFGETYHSEGRLSESFRSNPLFSGPAGRRQLDCLL